MKKVLLIVLITVMFISCSKNIVGDKIWVNEQSFWTEYTWMIKTGSGSGAVDRYSLFVEDNGNNKLIIAHFSNMINNSKAEKVDEKINVDVSKIERMNGEVSAITINGIKYRINSN